MTPQIQNRRRRVLRPFRSRPSTWETCLRVYFGDGFRESHEVATVLCGRRQLPQIGGGCFGLSSEESLAAIMG